MNSSNWLDHIESNIGKNVRTQFERAIDRNNNNLFVENVLAHDAQIMRPDEYYYGLSDHAKTGGRNHEAAQEAAVVFFLMSLRAQPTAAPIDRANLAYLARENVRSSLITV